MMVKHDLMILIDLIWKDISAWIQLAGSEALPLLMVMLEVGNSTTLV